MNTAVPVSYTHLDVYKRQSVAYTLVKEAAARRLAAKAAASAGTPAPLPVPQAAHSEAPAEGRQPAPPEKPAAKRARQTKKNGAGPAQGR